MSRSPQGGADQIWWKEYLSGRKKHCLQWATEVERYSKKIYEKMWKK